MGVKVKKTRFYFVIREIIAIFANDKRQCMVICLLNDDLSHKNGSAER